MNTDALKRKLGFSIDSGWVMPCVGFGSFLFVADTFNAPVLLGNDDGASYASLLLSVLLLALIAWWALRRDWDKRWSLPAIAVSTLCVSAYYIVSFYFPELMQQPALKVAIEIASVFGRAGLSFFWMVAILPLGSRRVCYALTFSICLFAFFCLLIVLFKDDAARMLLIMLPLLSAFCLHSFYRKRAESFELASPEKDEISAQSQEYLGKRSNYFIYGLGILVPLVCGSAVLAFVLQMGPDGSMDSSQLFSAQMGLLIGAIVMAALQLMLVHFFWTSTNLVFSSVVVPLFLMSMLLIAISDSGWMTAYFALMLLVEKSLIALAVYSAYMFRVGNNWMAPWCIAFLCFNLGELLGASFLRCLTFESSLFFLIAVVTLYIASVCLASLHFGVKITQAYEGHLAGGFRGESRFRAAVAGLAESYGLTSRESDILAELGRGRNAAYIAERLTISPQTAKTHQKNVYAKMGLHSQQDLIMLIDQAIEESRF